MTLEDKKIKTSIGTILLKELELLAKEKGMNTETVMSCLESSFQKILTQIYGDENDLRFHIRKEDGAFTIKRHQKIVETVTDAFKEIEHSTVPHMALNDEVITVIPFPELTRPLVQSLKNIFIKTLSQLERERQYEEFKDRVDHIISGVVKQVDGGNVIVDMGRAEAILRREEIIPRETYRINDRVKAYIHAVRRENHGHQIFLSRTHPNFLAKLFSQEVPEIYDGSIQIKAVARDPGSYAKVAIYAQDNSFDAIGACVGVRGSRVKAVSQELCGEKIDLVLWSADIPTFVVNALTPAEVVKVIVEKRKKITVVVPDNQQSMAIGRGGQNVRLAHQLTETSIDIVTESTESAQRISIRDRLVALFVDKLDLDEFMAHFLVSEGFENVDSLAHTPVSVLAHMEGLNQEIAEELHTRAQEAMREERKQYMQDFMEQGGDAKLLECGIPFRVFPTLAAHGIKTLAHFSDLSLDELLEITKDHDVCGPEEWGMLILKARTILSEEAGSNT